MSKILDNAFRNNLYKSLVEAGYGKEEAQMIVGKKYFAALQGATATKIRELDDAVQTGDFKKDFESLFADMIVSFKEMAKLAEFLNTAKESKPVEATPAGDKK